IRSDDDHLLAHIPGDRQSKSAANHIAEKIEQHVVEAPFVKAQLLEQFEAMNDAAAAAAASHFRAAQLHREHAVPLEAHIANLDLLAGEFFLRRSFDDSWASTPA